MFRSISKLSKTLLLYSSWRLTLITSYSFCSCFTICSFKSSFFTRRYILLLVPSPIRPQRIPSRLKALLANRPVMCDIVPGWFFTTSSIREYLLFCIILTTNHFCISLSRRYYRIYIFISFYRYVYQRWTRL